MSKQAVSAATTAIHDEDRVVLVKPNAVRIDSEGFVTRHLVVHAPTGAVADDMRDPGVWKLVQGNAATALRKYDSVTIFAADEAWMLQAMVSIARNDSAQLVIGKVSSFAVANEGLFSDGTYRVIFAGTGYGIERVSDGVPMGGAGMHASEALAVAALRNLYPKRVA